MQPNVTIRLAGPADAPALRRLAELDSRPLPHGDVLLAEVGGEARAAMEVAGGQAVADPFFPTEELASLLALRAEQLRHAPGSAHVRAGRVRHLVAATTGS
jgi:hypothetical protein